MTAKVGIAPQPACTTGDCGEERAVVSVSDARDFAAGLDRIKEQRLNSPTPVPLLVIDGSVIDEAQQLIRRLCDELEVRNRHLGRLQDGLERLENRCLHLINDALPECQVLDVREIRQLIQGSRRGP